VGRRGQRAASKVPKFKAISLAFAEKIKSELGIKAMYREVDQAGGTFALREHSEA
jgi:hypothetical protein